MAGLQTVWRTSVSCEWCGSRSNGATGIMAERAFLSEPIGAESGRADISRGLKRGEIIRPGQHFDGQEATQMVISPGIPLRCAPVSTPWSMSPNWGCRIQKRLNSNHYGICGIMVEAVTKIDRSGRVVIPKEIRRKMGLEGDTALLVADATDEIVVLKKLDVKDLARMLRQELKGTDVETVGRRVEKESNELAKRRRKALRSRR